jgi:membrane peptidoglycan carboxypeptidase
VSSGAAPSPAGFATRQSVARLRARTVARRLAIAVLGLVLIGAIGGFVYLSALRGVGDAQQRARRILAAHHEPAGMPAPARLVAAVVSVEDEHFNDNVAVNVLSGAGRAGLAAVDGGGDQGGSTIEQQLARQLYPGGSTLQDIGLGVKLAMSYGKPQIMRMYLNVGYYGHGLWGVSEAARGYFATTPAHLTWAEAAMLGGLLQAPSDYDPLKHYALARERERHVLAQLVVNRHLRLRQAAALFRAPLPLR